MGRSRGKSKKAIEAASNDDEDGSGGEEVPPTPKRRGRPQKQPLKDDDADKAEDKDIVELEEDHADGIKPIVRPSKDSSKKRRRRRRLKRSSDESVQEGEGGRLRSKPNGFRPNGSRRKSTPRRAAEAGVECR